MDRKKGYIILISLIFVSILLTTNNYIENPYENQKNYFDNLKTSDSIAIYSPTDSTVVDLTISTLLTVEWSSGVAAMCRIRLCDFSTEVESLGTYNNRGKVQPGYINSNTVNISSDHPPGDYYRIKLIDVNDRWNYDYSDFFTILNDDYISPQEEEDDPPLPDPTDSVDDNFFMVLMMVLIITPIGIALAVIITRFNIKMSEKPKPRTKSTLSIKVLKNQIFNTIEEVYELINLDQVEEASIRFEEILKIIREENNPKLKQICKARITHIKPIIDNHNIRKIKKVVLDLGNKVSLLDLEEIIERTNFHDEELIEKVIDDMIKNSEIYAEYRDNIKTIFFDQQENTESIDRLMKTYRDWEKKQFSKKI